MATNHRRTRLGLPKDIKHLSIKQRVESAMDFALQGAKARSKEGGVPFDLTMEWLIEQVERQKFRCKLTGIEFYSAAAARGRYDPYVPSLDRIKASGGYTKDNVRVVILAVNIMLLDWGQEVFEDVAISYQLHQKKEEVSRNRNAWRTKSSAQILWPPTKGL